jgi:hypothetical protein
MGYLPHSCSLPGVGAPFLRGSVEIEEWVTWVPSLRLAVVVASLYLLVSLSALFVASQKPIVLGSLVPSAY